jgi:hypothetical protein
MVDDRSIHWSPTEDAIWISATPEGDYAGTQLADHRTIFRLNLASGALTALPVVVATRGLRRWHRMVAPYPQ